MNGLYLKMRFSQCYISAHVEEARNGDHRELSPLCLSGRIAGAQLPVSFCSMRMMSQIQERRR